MTDTLRHQALGALAVLHHTSHQDKADILTAYMEALEAQSSIALDRAAMLHDWGWQLCRRRSSVDMLRLRHPRSFYEVDLRPNGDAEFRLMRVKSSHWIGAEDMEAFKAYIDTIDRGEQKSLRFAKQFLTVAVAILVAIVAHWIGVAN